MPKFRKIIAGLLLCTVLMSLCSLTAAAESLPGTTPALSAESAVLIELSTGEVAFETNGSKRLPMASTTKIMTAMTALSTRAFTGRKVI